MEWRALPETFLRPGIERDTLLMPRLIADSVLQEASRFLGEHSRGNGRIGCIVLLARPILSKASKWCRTGLEFLAHSDR